MYFGGLRLYAQDLNACPERSRLVYHTVGTLPGAGPTRLGMIGAPEPDPAYRDHTEILLPASEEAMLVLESGACSLGVAFNAQSGSEYEIQFRVTSQTCFVRV